ncbi:MAG: enoyl-CoA hydratase/isomerase family protein [Balneolaceae bacterium]|nr:enoyl-CoA hydratase/isomerase family protein [Balneolaceae bacterium]
MKPILTEKIDTTLWLTINRPKVKNPINFEIMDRLETLLDRIEKDETVRALVLKGAGETFISGGDLQEFHGIRTADEAQDMARRMLSILARIEKLPCWTIACVNGPAYGGGCEIMLAFDFRIAAESATFGFTQGRFYLPPGWGGLTRLIERVGRSTALRWLAETAVIDTDSAIGHRLIDRVAPDEELDAATQQWVERLTRNDRNYIRTLKEGALRHSESRWKRIEEELKPFSYFWEDEKHHQRVQKFLERKQK